MNRHEFRAKDYLLHMLEFLDRIQEYTAGVSQEAFFASQLLQDAVIRNIEITGEAAKQLLDVAPEFSKTHPEIPFAQVYGMRNRVAHAYALVSPHVIWETVRQEVPELRAQIASVLKSLNDSAGRA